MKEVLSGSVLRHLKCINPLGEYKVGEKYDVYIQYLVNSKGVAVWVHGFGIDPKYTTFESPTELLAYFDCHEKLKEKLKNLEENGATYSMDLI